MPAEAWERLDSGQRAGMLDGMAFSQGYLRAVWARFGGTGRGAVTLAHTHKEAQAFRMRLLLTQAGAFLPLEARAVPPPIVGSQVVDFPNRPGEEAAPQGTVGESIVSGTDAPGGARGQLESG